jgi:putative transposase
LTGCSGGCEAGGLTTVGIDVGLESFVTLSTGEKIENPRFFRTDEKALAKAQRRLSKAEKGTPERKKARKIVAHVHERIANRRLNFAHQTSRKVVDRFGTIVFEDLHITTMQKNPHLAKSIADVAWNQFITITGSKAEEAGSQVILVNPRNTSQMCSGCGMIVAKTLSDRVHSCPHCGLAMDRDQNAGVQYYEIGTAISGLKNPGCPRLKSGEQSPEDRRSAIHLAHQGLLGRTVR